MKMKKLLSLMLAASCIAMIGVPAAAEENTVVEWFQYDHFSNEIWQACPVLQYAEAETGVTVNVVTAPWGECDTKLNLMLASGELPDVYMNFWYPWTENFSYLVEDGEIVDLTEYLDNYPNLKEYIYGDETFSQLFVTDENGVEHIYGIPKYMGSRENANIAIRKDLLEKYGLETPTTWDELHDALVVIKENEDIAGFTVADLANFEVFATTWTGAYQQMQDENGDWMYVAASDGYREYLKYFNTWWEEGLIDEDALLGQDGIHIEKMAAGKTIASYQQWNPDFVSQYREPLNEMGAEVELIPYLVLNEGDEPVVRAGTGNYLGWQMVNAKTGNVEAVLEFYDYLLANDGIMTRKGIEGVHYEVNEDGTTTWLDAYYSELERENSWNFKYDTTTPRFFIDYLNEEVGRLSPLCENADIINEGWQKILDAKAIAAPYLYQFTSENYVNCSGNIDTVIAEWRTAFITGTKDIDTEWEAYLAALDEVGYNLVIADLNEWMAQY